MPQSSVAQPSDDPNDTLRGALRVFSALENVWWQVRPEPQMIRVLNHLGHVGRVVELLELVGGEVTVAAHGLFADLSIDPARFSAAAVALRMSFPDVLSDSPDVQWLFDNCDEARPGQLVGLLMAAPPAEAP